MNGLELQDILLTFPEGGRRRTVLDIPYLKVTSGEHIGIRGASGSGKSSLLNVVSGLVLPDRGTVRWGATVPGALPEHERDRWRGQHIGFVFQDFQLFPELEALENVLLPGSLDPARARPDRTNARLPHPESTGAVAWGKAAGRHCAGRAAQTGHHSGGRAHGKP